jgi:hypothetical protein
MINIPHPLSQGTCVDVVCLTETLSLLVRDSRISLAKMVAGKAKAALLKRLLPAKTAGALAQLLDGLVGCVVGSTYQGMFSVILATTFDEHKAFHAIQCATCMQC